MWRKQAAIEWTRRGISIVACCNIVKFCALSVRPFQSQQSGALTRMLRECQVQIAHNEHEIGAVHCENKGMLFQPLSWCCVESTIHHEQNVRKRETHKYPTCDANKQ